MEQRLFIGTALEAPQSKQIASLQQQLLQYGSPTPMVNLHMTVAFLGLVNKNQYRQLVTSIDKLAKQAFTITFNQLTLWKKPKILCVASEQTPLTLTHLQQQCQLIANDVGLAQQLSDYTPHITLCRKVSQCPDIDIEPMIHSPQQLHLYLSQPSQTGVHYRSLQSWPFRQQNK